MTDPWIFQPCLPASPAHAAQAHVRQQQLTKPLGAFGQLESVVEQLAGLQQRALPKADDIPVLIFAADHGVVAQGVSAYPPEVTVQMLGNFITGGAAIAVLARELGLPLHVHDVGTLAPEPLPQVVTDKPCCGTADFTEGAAMSAEQLQHALAAGRRAVATVADAPIDLLILGEMGIGNTTSASALACVLIGDPAEALVGAGTGLDAARIAHKQSVVTHALQLHAVHATAAQSPGLEALRRVGGLEIAAMAGAMLAAGQRGIPVLVDGFIVTAAALAATKINPSVAPWLLYSHQSAEYGHRRLLQQLQARPLLRLDLRLGEGSGAAVAVPLLRLACALHAQMATFAEAAVAGANTATPAR